MSVSSRSARRGHRPGLFVCALLLLAGCLAAGSRPARASSTGYERFLDVAQWSVSFHIHVTYEGTDVGTDLTGTETWNDSADSSGTLISQSVPGIPGGAWGGYPTSDHASIEHRIDAHYTDSGKPYHQDCVGGGFEVYPGGVPPVASLAIDPQRGVYRLFPWAAYGNVTCQDSDGGHSDVTLSVLGVLLPELPLPQTGMVISDLRTFSGPEANLPPGVTIEEEWQLIPGTDSPHVTIDSIVTPALEDGKHTFISTDPISIHASVTGVRDGDSATVRWTVIGREAAAPVRGFPRNVSKAVSSGKAEFQFTPADNRALVTNRRDKWTLGSRKANPPLAFQVTAELIVRGRVRDSAEVEDTELRQDSRDTLRQEYVDYKLVAPRVVVPPREEVDAPLATAAFPGDAFNGGNYTTPAVVRNGAMQGLAQNTQSAYGGPLHVNSAFRNPQRNKTVKGKPASRHMFGDAVDLEPTGEAGMDRVARRRAYLALYRAALTAGAGVVLLEQGPRQLLPGNWDIPAPSTQSPDNDGDGIPDQLKVKLHGESVLVQAMFDEASHVHLENGAAGATSDSFEGDL